MKLTNKQRVINFASNYPAGFSASDLKNALKSKSPNLVSALLWAMKKDGVLVHDKEAGLYRLANTNTNTNGNGSGTHIANTAPAKEPVIPFDEYETVLLDYASLKQKHDDALAIIRYLESKLLTTIQFASQQSKSDARS